MRLLLVHGSLSVYRLARLIKYSFYKNITLAFLLFMLQPFGGWSGASHWSLKLHSQAAPHHPVLIYPHPVLIYCNAHQHCISTMRSQVSSQTLPAGALRGTGSEAMSFCCAGQAMLDGITASFINAFFVRPFCPSSLFLHFTHQLSMLHHVTWHMCQQPPMRVCWS